MAVMAVKELVQAILKIYEELLLPLWGDKRVMDKISNAERGTHVTIICAISTAGHFIPTGFINGRKRMKSKLLRKSSFWIYWNDIRLKFY